jgi:hypothetical protein
VEFFGFGPEGKLRHDVELFEQLPDDFTRIVSLAELLEPLEDARQRFLSLRDRHLRVVLALALEALVMASKFFAVELRETLTGSAKDRSRMTWDVGGRQTTLQGHAAGAHPV